MMNYSLLLIPIIVLTIFIYFFKYRNKTGFIKSTIGQTSILIVLGGLFIFKLINFENNSSTIIQLALLFIALMFGIRKYIQKTKIKS